MNAINKRLAATRCCYVATIVRQWLGLVVLLMLVGSSAFGGEATLTICNKGSVAINVVEAIEDSLFLGAILKVNGWTRIPPGDCERVYKEHGDEDGEPEHAYIGFAFDADFIPGRIEQVPDFGHFRFGTKVLSKSTKRLCVRQETMDFVKQPNDSSVDCASFHSDRNDPGGYVSFASALYFVPKASACISGSYHDYSCGGGDYYLNVKPSAGDRELHASGGSARSESDKEQPPAGPSLGDQLMNELGKYADEQRKRREEMEAEARQKREQALAAARENAPICVPASLVENHAWNNPPPGGKMEAFKSAVRMALRDEAQNLADEPVYWVVIGDHYDTFNPATTDPRTLVFSLGSDRRCYVNTYEYTLPLNPYPPAEPLEPASPPAPTVDNHSMTPDDNPLGEAGIITPFQPPP